MAFRAIILAFLVSLPMVAGATTGVFDSPTACQQMAVHFAKAVTGGNIRGLPMGSITIGQVSELPERAYVVPISVADRSIGNGLISQEVSVTTQVINGRCRVMKFEALNLPESGPFRSSAVCPDTIERVLYAAAQLNQLAYLASPFILDQRVIEDSSSHLVVAADIEKFFNPLTGYIDFGRHSMVVTADKSGGFCRVTRFELVRHQ